MQHIGDVLGEFVPPSYPKGGGMVTGHPLNRFLKNSSRLFQANAWRTSQLWAKDTMNQGPIPHEHKKEEMFKVI
jgi:hypothetical protein